MSKPWGRLSIAAFSPLLTQLTIHSSEQIVAQWQLKYRELVTMQNFWRTLLKGYGKMPWPAEITI